MTKKKFDEYLINDSIALAKEILIMLKEDLEVPLLDFDEITPEAYIHGYLLMKRDRLLRERVVKI